MQSDQWQQNSATNVVLSNNPTLVTPVLGTPSSGTLSNCTVDGTDTVGFRNIPLNSQSANYTTVLAATSRVVLNIVVKQQNYRIIIRHLTLPELCPNSARFYVSFYYFTKLHWNCTQSYINVSRTPIHAVLINIYRPHNTFIYCVI